MMNLNQTKFIELTMELDLKTREYNKLCEKLEQIKQSNINPNDIKLLELKKLFQKNHNDIVQINKQIKELKKNEELKEKQKFEKYDTANLFNKTTNNLKETEKENMNIAVIETKKSILQRFIDKIKKIFKIK